MTMTEKAIIGRVDHSRRPFLHSVARGSATLFRKRHVRDRPNANLRPKINKKNLAPHIASFPLLRAIEIYPRSPSSMRAPLRHKVCLNIFLAAEHRSYASKKTHLGVRWGGGKGGGYGGARETFFTPTW